MHTKSPISAAFIAPFFALCAGIAHANSATAGEGAQEYPMAITSTVSRAEVYADLLRSRAAGLVPQGEWLPVAPSHGPALTRAQVKAETLEAIRLGVISIGEQNRFPNAMQLEQIRMAGERALSTTMAAR